MTKFLFDVDGTLTDPRKQIDPEFEQVMLEFVNNHQCVIVTGSDRPKTVEQIGLELTNAFERVYHCSGNHVFIGSQEHHKNTWTLTQQQHDFLQQQVDSIDYPEKTGNHIEQRTGTANFSIVGRNADWDQRARYAEWESKNKGRDFIAEAYNNAFSDSVAQVAGETSIDIYKKGCDKSQAVKEQKGTTIYFGDHCYPGGNDYTASQEATVYHQISEGYKETWKILKNQYI